MNFMFLSFLMARIKLSIFFSKTILGITMAMLIFTLMTTRRKDSEQVLDIIRLPLISMGKIRIDI